MGFKHLLVILSLGILLTKHLEAQTFTSLEQKTGLLELFTSQGCSSCPPAERWFNKFTNDKRLWQEFVPLAFHVDYWDYLGWQDIYADKNHSKRQRDYYRAGKTTAVYTPGFVLNGKQWTAWRYRNSIPTTKSKTGILSAKLEGKTLSARYNDNRTNFILNIAILGFDIKTSINAGENSGKKLPQEFVVLKHLRTESNAGQWELTLPDYKQSEIKRYAIALWLSRPGDPTPVQATGGWLK